jgi:Mn2+/Fe2+ NRAMP family transporter
VVVGSVLTGVIGFFVVIACAATLHKDGITIRDASDAALALKPLAGSMASSLFAVGLIGAAVLAASILPLSTAYSVGEFAGRETALNDGPREAPLFYGTYATIAIISAAIVLIPGAPLIPILILTQVLNAVLLVPLLGFMYGISRNTDVMGQHAAGRVARGAYLVGIAAIVVCIAALAVLSLT